jgi:hypothetical protein
MATRGRLAEYIIATAIGAADGVRDEWAAYDLLDPRGISIEVKSYPETNRQSDVKRRQAEVYVFALLAHQHQATDGATRARGRRGRQCAT